MSASSGFAGSSFVRWFVGALCGCLIPAAVAQTLPSFTSLSGPRQVVTSGQSLTLSATVNGTSPVSFQWKRRGVPMAGATSADLAITNATGVRDSGWYQVIATNAAGSITSAPVFVNVAVNPALVATWGATIYAPIPAPAGLAVISAVAAGGTHALALRGDGTVVSWGVDLGGQTVVPGGLAGVVRIAAGGYHSLALKSDGTLVAWGPNFHGEAAVPPSLTGVVDMAGGSSFSVALKADGTVVAWGSNTEGVGETTVPPGLTGVVALAAGQQHTLALKSDGTVVGWGDNRYSHATSPAGLTGVVAIAAGALHSLALKSDGTVVAWGYSADGQTAVPSGLSNVVAIAAGEQHSVALKADGTVVVWGVDTLGVRTGAASLRNGVGVASSSYFGVLLAKDTGAQAAPVITASPQSVTVLAGQPVTLSVTATGTPAPTYQWSRNSVPISGATGAALPFATAVATDAGSYAVSVTNSLGTVTSAPATLAVGAVQLNPLGAASSSLWSVSANQFLGTRVTITAPTEAVAAIADFANGSGTLFAALVPLSSATDVPGGTSTVDTPFGTAAIAASALFTLPSGFSGRVTVPLSADLTPGVYGVVFGTGYLGATGSGSMLRFGSVSGSSGFYRWGPAGGPYTWSHTTSNHWSIGLATVTGAAAAPAIVVPPAAVAVALGGKTTLSVVASGTGPLAFQWLKGGSPISSATASTLLLTPVTADTAGVYSVVVSNSLGQATGVGAAVSLTTVPSPVVTVFPASGSNTILASSTQTLSAVAVPEFGRTIVFVTFYANGTMIGAPLSSAPYVVNWTPGTPGNYEITARASDNAGVSTISPAVTYIAASGFGPTVTLDSPSAGAVLRLFAPVTLSATAAPSFPNTITSVEFYANGTLLAVDTTAPFECIWSPGGTGPVALTAVAKDSLANVTTSTAVNVSVAQAPVVTAFAAPRQSVNLGASFGLTVVATSSETPAYQWKRNGFPIAGATNATYASSNATPARDNGWYQVVVTNGAGSTLSPVTFVNVAVNPSQVAGWGYGYYGQPALQTGLGGVSAVAVGGYHALALRSDGTVAAWGSNAFGESSVAGGLNGIVAVAAGNYFSLALKSDGTVVAWGNNGDGQVTPPSGLTGVVAIAAGYSHALALKSDGTVVAWGWNVYGQCFVPTGLSGVVAIGGGTYHSLALKSDGTVAAWGYNGNGQAASPSGLNGVVAIAAGGYHNLALKSDGSIVAWGTGSSGQTTPPVGLTGVVALSAGANHSLALKSDGTAVGWGDNYYGQSSLSPGLANVVGLYGGGSTTLVLRNPAADTALPSITTQPATQTAYLTGTANLSVALAPNPAPASYQWRKGGTTISGATGPVYTIYGLQLSDAGAYDVVVTNGVGSVTSAAATLSVVAPPLPTISAHPAGGILNVGNVGSFRVSATSPVSLTYQWRKNGVALSGKVGSELILGTVQLADAGTYDVVVTNLSGPVTSTPATLVVNPFTAPVFSVQPVGGIIDVGNVAHFFATVTGAVPLSYQWRKDGVPLPGATGPTLILGNAQLADAGLYDLVATNGLGSTTSAGATLLFPSLLTLPTVSQPPANQVALVGVTASLSIVASGVPAPTLQWRRSGVPLVGATSAAYNIGLVQENDGGTYDVVVTNFKGSIVSSPATLTVQGRPVIWTARLALGSGDAVGTFTLEGTASKRLLVRAVGPTLGTFGVIDPLQDPKLEIYDTAGQLVAANDDWSTHADQPGLISATAAAGAFALSAGSKDAVVLRSYAPGTYFARTSAAGGSGRIVLLELYDAEPASLSRVPYTAVRGSAAPSGGEIVVGGLGANGTSQRTYLLRASGPALGSVGTLPNPTFTVLRDSVARAGNDDWQTGPDTTGVAAAAARVGTFAFADGSRDSALLVTAYVRSGLYIGQVAGAGGNSGLVLAEAIEADEGRPTVYAPAVVSPPASRVSPAGTNVTLEARATGTAPILYQWRKDGITLNGATLRSLALPNVVPANAGVYTVVASNVHGTSTSLPAVLAVDSAAAVAVATHAIAPPGGYVAGSTLMVNNTLTYPGAVTGLGWTVTLPAGWSYVGGGGAEGDVKPSLGATGTLEWSWSTPPTSPVSFSYLLNVPPGETNIRSLGATALVRTGTSVQTMTTTPAPLLLIPLVALHSADTNQDFALGLFELTRVIELYNTRLGTTRTGCYAVATTASSEDGFVVDAVRSGSATVTLGRYHSGDTNKDGKFSLPELTRVIELFNTRTGSSRTGAYHVQAGTEDGFAPGP